VKKVVITQVTRARVVTWSIREAFYEPLMIIWMNRKSRIGLLILVFYLLMASIGPYLIPYDPKGNPLEIYQPPSLKHPLGTDYMGRDVLAQIVHGARDILLIAFFAASITVLVGAAVGITSGFVGGVTDVILVNFTRLLMTIPSLPLIIVLSAFLRVADPLSIAMILSVTAWTGLALAVRAQVLALKNEEYIEAARTLGLTKFHIIFREILPNIMSYVAINFLTSMVSAIYASSGLYFLGILPFTAVNWGVMLNQAWRIGGGAALANPMYAPKTLHYILAPIMAIIGLQVGLILLTFAIDEIFNPRLRTEYIKKLESPRGKKEPQKKERDQF